MERAPQDPPRQDPLDPIPNGGNESVALAPTLLRPPTESELRDALQQAVLKDLLGPAGGPEEEVDEDRVSERYLVGMLAPKLQRVEPESMDELAESSAGTAEEGTPDVGTPPGQRTMFPSSFGLTFTVDGRTAALRATVRWGRYQRIESETLKDPKTGNPKLIWKRSQMESVVEPIPLAEGRIAPLPITEEQPAVVLKGLVRRHNDDWIVTLFLVNGMPLRRRWPDETWLFQPELSVEGTDRGAVFCRRPLCRDRRRIDPLTFAEAERMGMLYRHHAEFAVGHGIAVHAEADRADPSTAVCLSTRVVPEYEVPQQTAPTSEDKPALVGLTLDMRELAEASGADLIAALAVLPDAYAAWILEQRAKVADPQEKLEPYQESAGDALSECERAQVRIRAGIELLANDPQAREAFRFANRAMWLQRTHTLLAREKRRGNPVAMETIDIPRNRSWRPFQLAFLLLNLPSVSDLHHPDRSHPSAAVADLLWFPTGGGKTEAYLGLAAFTMGLRRLQGTIAGRPGEDGVAVLMRYTLRLLTLQQFQRAAALMCACEVLRQEAESKGDACWGRTPFRLGLWVGAKTTPNSTEQSHEALLAAHGAKPRGGGTPVQLTSCPWCGTTIQPDKHMKVLRVAGDRGRTLIYCGDPLGRCPFSYRQSPEEGLPVLVVDEEIYRRLPSLLIATVDKFAQMPWKGETQMLFGQVNAVCPRHGFRSPDLDDADSHPRRHDLLPVKTAPHPPLRPPDLIIQDELHLISGPLGTLVGLYETAVDELCTWEVDGQRVRPKVIASTATIRRAESQVRSLFLREVAIFPPQGLDIRDNFFSIQRSPSEKHPGRRYLGICATGRRFPTALIRVYVAFLAAAQQLYEQKGYGAAVDPWMTLVGYFNSIRELGGTRRLVEDDIASRLRDMDQRGLAQRRRPILQELTSRMGATEIPQTLDRLEVRFDPEDDQKRKERRSLRERVESLEPLDVLLATNMISVGVDVDRLGLMVVAGQPKSTAEYIQATSRVGRSHPGLVCTIYNWARPRDLSHYERFEQYHATFYQHVEALSVTPFTPRALDRGLSALLVALIRLAGEDYNANVRAGTLNRDHPIVRRAVETIVRRAELVCESKQAGDEVRAMLETRLDDWLSQVTQMEASVQLGYKMAKDGLTRGLLQQPGPSGWERFTCPNSLREVEPGVGLVLMSGQRQDAETAADTVPLDAIEMATSAGGDD